MDEVIIEPSGDPEVKLEQGDCIIQPANNGDVDHLEAQQQQHQQLSLPVSSSLSSHEQESLQDLVHRPSQIQRGTRSFLCGIRCATRGIMFGVVFFGATLLLVHLCRIAELNATDATSSPAFANFNYWLILCCAPFVSWKAFRRNHHASLPWFGLILACLSYMVISQYTTRIGAARNPCTKYADGSSVEKRDCDMTYLGYSGAFLIFSAQIIVFWVTTYTASYAPPTWDEVLCLLSKVRGRVVESVPQSQTWDLFFRLLQLIFSFSGFLFWMIELAYFSNKNQTSTGKSALPFTDWYVWVVLFAAPLSIAASFSSPVHRIIPFIATIVTFVLFYVSMALTQSTAFCAAYVADNANFTESLYVREQLMNCNFVFVGFVGVLFMWLGMLCFLALAASDVFSSLAKYNGQQLSVPDSPKVKILRIIAAILGMLGVALWIILLSKTAEFIVKTNEENPLCSATSQSACMFWYEWYWWQLIPIALIIVLCSSILRTPRAAVPFYCALLSAIFFYTTQILSAPQSNAVNGIVYISGVQSCRSFFTTTAPPETVHYCEMQDIGFAGVIMIIFSMLLGLYVSAGRMAPRGTFVLFRPSESSLS